MAAKQDIKYLECTSGSASKFYNVEIIAVNGQHSVRCHWGRIGTKGQYQDKGLFNGITRAETKRAKLIRSKKLKGYKDVTAKKGKALTKALKAEDKPITKHEVSLSRFADLLE